MTPEECHLWYDFFKKLPVTVNRQKMIGEYIVNFYIHSALLVIELDGRQHRSMEHRQKDMIRDAYLTSLGITVLRYDNRKIREHFNLVCDDISSHLRL